MHVNPRLLVPVVLIFSLASAPASAGPIIVTFTSPATVFEAYPGAAPVAFEDFSDGVFDLRMLVPGGGTFYDPSGPPSEGYITTGPATYSLRTGTADIGIISYFPPAAGTPAVPVPNVGIWSGDSWWEIGPLLGAQESQNSTSRFFAFYSSYPFSKIMIDPGDGQSFNADAIGFAQVPVPEPASTLVLLTLGLAATAAGRVRRGGR